MLHQEKKEKERNARIQAFEYGATIKGAKRPCSVSSRRFFDDVRIDVAPVASPTPAPHYLRVETCRVEGGPDAE